MKLFYYITVVSAVLVLFCGCAVKPQAETDINTICRQQAQGIITAIAEKDYAGYSKFAGEVAEIKDRRNFILSCGDMEKRLGKVTGFVYLTSLDTPEVANLIYRIDFLRSNPGGKSLKHQQLFQLIFGEVDGRVRLLGMRVM